MEDGELAVHPGVLAAGEWQNLERHVRLLGRLDQPPELLGHHRRAADLAAGHRLVQDHLVPGSVLPREHRVPVDAQLQPAVDVVGPGVERMASSTARA